MMPTLDSTDFTVGCVHYRYTMNAAGCLRGYHRTDQAAEWDEMLLGSDHPQATAIAHRLFGIDEHGYMKRGAYAGR